MTPWYLTGAAGFSSLMVLATRVPLRAMVAIWKLTLSPADTVTLPKKEHAQLQQKCLRGQKKDRFVH